EARPTDLHVAREQVLKRKDSKAQYSYDALVAALDKQFGKNAVKRGSQVFADNCARCHSSIPESEGGAFQHRDFRAANDQGMRLDWLGNDQLTPVTEVGTYRCRALHSNHMKDHVWEEYGSETLRARAKVAGVKEPNDGGRGYYRNVSLISLWAHAPFAHNNAIGPEICGQPKNRENFFYRSPYVDRASKQLLPDDKAPACMNYDPDVEGRFSLYVKSMEDLLNPAQRVPKITKLDVDVPLPLELRSVENGEEKKVVGLTVLIPKGTTAAGLVNFRHKDFANDLVQLKLDPQGLEQRLAKDLGPEEATATVNELRSLVAEFLKQPKDGKVMPVAVMRSHPKLVEFYSNCTADIENDGHPFGQDLSEADKKALIAFLATM
ncbi:MAG TPA: hypothetical protein VJM53_03560, partial [Burkholderiales bacterium]|nr:hypothetical protein [Burkholderiales bacterium]